MHLDLAVDQLLTPYVSRVQVRSGNGLTRSMNSSLRSYPEIPRIIRRSVTLLASMEILIGLSGTVAIRNTNLYRLLIDAHEDWYRDLVLMGTRDFIGYALAFLLALPGFAYGYYQPEGRPLEFWLWVLVRFYTKPQVISASPLVLRPRWKVFLGQIDPIINALWRMVRMKKIHKRERGARG